MKRKLRKRKRELKIDWWMKDWLQDRGEWRKVEIALTVWRWEWRKFGKTC